MTYDCLSYETGAGVATITLDRPDQLNAFTPAMVGEWLDAFDRVDADDDVRVVVVTGRGRAFCAGADLRARDDGEHAWRDSNRYRDNAGYVALRAYRCTKPTIAAINGAAVGVGLTLTLPMDARFVVTGAKLGFVFGARGILPDGAASWFLPRVCGINRALEWCLSGRTFGPEEALAGNLVRSIHPPSELMPAAYALASEIVTNVAPVSASLTRQLLWRMLSCDDPMDAHLIESSGNKVLRRSPDAREGARAFFEHRSPTWTMRPSRDTPEVFTGAQGPTRGRN